MLINKISYTKSAYTGKEVLCKKNIDASQLNTNLPSAPSRIYFAGAQKVCAITREAATLFKKQGYDIIGKTTVNRKYGNDAEEVFVGIKKSLLKADSFTLEGQNSALKKPLPISEYFEKGCRTTVILVNKFGEILGLCDIKPHCSSAFREVEEKNGAKSLVIDLIANLTSPQNFKPDKYVDISFLNEFKRLFSKTEYKLVSTSLIKIAQDLSEKLGHEGRLELFADATRQKGYKKLGFSCMEINPQHMITTKPIRTPKPHKTV